MRKLIQWLLLSLAVIEIAGGHLVVAQGDAWLKMLVQYSQAEGLKEGLVKTFNGDHSRHFYGCRGSHSWPMKSRGA